jgi:hypothetical protein
MAWQDRNHAGLGLRLAGALLLVLAGLIGHRLFATPDPHAKREPVAYLLALIGMSSASTGAALMVLGRHLFDQVNLPPRWTIHNAPRRKA